MATVRPSSVALLAALIALSTACKPSCDQVCTKVVECGGTPQLTVDACKLQCDAQDTLIHSDWQDAALEERFNAHKRCVLQATCDDLDAGVCYDEDLFGF